MQSKSDAMVFLLFLSFHHFFQVKEKICQSSLDMLLFVPLVGEIVENDGGIFMVGLWFLLVGSGAW